MAASPPSSPDDEPKPSKRRFRTGATVFWGAAALVLVITLAGGEDEKCEAARVPHAPPAAASNPAPASTPSDAPRRSDGPRMSDAPRRSHASTPPAGRRAEKHLPRSKPVRLRIPKIRVDAPFTDLTIGRAGQLEPPPAHDTNLVGWYAKGVSPGEVGTAIIAGHVDTITSPAVFARLGELRKGDRFQVARADGRTATFVVDSAESFDKDDFPSERVYGDTPQAQVRLITCAGVYDRRARDYTENLVVFAHLV